MGGLAIAVIFALIFYILLALFIVSVPLFSYIVFERVSQTMSLISKIIFGSTVLVVNLFILIGGYFVVIRPLVHVVKGLF